jgi:hypothetical protein
MKDLKLSESRRSKSEVDGGEFVFDLALDGALREDESNEVDRQCVDQAGDAAYMRSEGELFERGEEAVKGRKSMRSLKTGRRKGLIRTAGVGGNRQSCDQIDRTRASRGTDRLA